MSWNLQQPVTSEISAAKANKDASDISSASAWRTAMDVVSTAESRRLGSRDLSGVAFDGSTTGTRIYCPCQSIGSGPFSVWTRFKMPSSIPSSGNGSLPGIFGLSDLNGSTYRPNACALYLYGGNNSISFIKYGSNQATDNRVASIASAIAAYANQIVDVVLTRNGSTLKIYINGIDTAYAETTGGTPPLWSDTVPTDFLIVGAQTSASPFNSSIHRTVLFNRALSAAEVSDLVANGVNPVDQWGTQVQIINGSTLNGGFETNLLSAIGTWGPSTLGTSTATIDTSGTFSRTGTNCGKFTLDSSGSYASFFPNYNVSVTPGNKRYRLSFWARKGVSSGLCGVQWGAGTVVSNTGLVLSTTYAQWMSEFVISDSGFNIARQSGSAAGSEIYLDDIVLERIGAIVDLDFSPGIGLSFPDRSTNLLNGVGTGGISHTLPKKYGRMQVVADLTHSDISTTAGTTKLMDLPPNCGIMFVELDRTTAFDSGITLEVGTSGSSTRYLAATAASSVGITGADSANKASESNSANSSIYVRKSGSTTTGRVRVRVTYDIRG